LPANVAISAETSKLQTELLQLSLLHRDAALVRQEWEADAERKLRQRFERVRGGMQDLLGKEEGVQKLGNAGILKGWEAGQGIEERVQLLDEVLAGTWGLCGPGGKYARLVRKFESWMQTCADIQAARTDASASDLRFVEPLDMPWKEESVVLLRKLEAWREQMMLLRLNPADDEPEHTQFSLDRAVAGVWHTVDNMVQEIGAMGRIEAEVMRREEAWIRERVEDDSEDEPGDALGGRHGIWRL
jgi:hypothetical protein